MTNRRSTDQGRWTGASARGLAVVDGRVACPRTGRVDVVVCFACPQCRGLTAEHLERVVCGWDPRLETAGAHTVLFQDE